MNTGIPKNNSSMKHFSLIFSWPKNSTLKEGLLKLCFIWWLQRGKTSPVKKALN